MENRTIDLAAFADRLKGQRNDALDQAAQLLALADDLTTENGELKREAVDLAQELAVANTANRDLTEQLRELREL